MRTFNITVNKSNETSVSDAHRGIPTKTLGLGFLDLHRRRMLDSIYLVRNVYELRFASKGGLKTEMLSLKVYSLTLESIILNHC